MSNIIRIKRRASGNAGAPAALKSAELAHNEVDSTLYIGKGDDGSGNATSVMALAGSGAFADLSTSQTIGGAKTFSIVPKASQDASGGTDLVRKSQVDTLLAAKAPLASPALTGTPTAPTAAPATNTTQIATTAFVQEALSAAGTGDMSKSVYDTTNNGKVDVAETAEAVPWTGVTGKPSSFPPSAHSHPTSEVTSGTLAVTWNGTGSQYLKTGFSIWQLVNPASITPVVTTNAASATSITASVSRSSSQVGLAMASPNVDSGSNISWANASLKYNILGNSTTRWSAAQIDTQTGTFNVTGTQSATGNIMRVTAAVWS